MKRAHIGAILNFDLCDLQKVGQIKNLGIMSWILIRCTYSVLVLTRLFPVLAALNWPGCDPHGRDSWHLHSGDIYFYDEKIT
jgi:hypothetical protein